MTRCILIDVDHTMVKGGTTEFLPGVKERLKKIAQQGDIWLFTSCPMGPVLQTIIKEMGVPVAGYIPKPLADEYVIFDDKVVYSAQEIPTSIAVTLDWEGTRKAHT
jgi:predicted HAD superfamily phosphohydrolase YqeG